MTRRRLIAVAVGLTLGWLAAGFVPSVTTAADAPHGAKDAAGHKHDAGQVAAEALVPHDAAGHAAAPVWLRPMLLTVAGLFAAAVLVGVPLLKSAGGDPATKAAAYDKAHAQHDGHDAHGDAPGEHAKHGH